MFNVGYIFVITLLENVNLVYTQTYQSMNDEHVPKNTSLNVKPRILLGEPAQLGQYPWMTYINYDSVSKGNKHFCVGSIISHRHVLTAGHCCSDAVRESIRVRTGEFDLDMDPDCEFEIFHTNKLGWGCDIYIKEYKLDKVSVHTAYDPRTFPTGDLCILRTSEEIIFNKYVDKINLPFDNGVDFKDKLFWGEHMYAIGWGALNEAVSFKRTFLLMRALLNVVNEEDCMNKWRPYFPHIVDNISYDHICAGSSSRSTVCHGDPGGPLMYENEGKTYIIGVASASVKCIAFNPIDIPGIFVRPDWYQDWIRERLKH